MKNNAFYGTHKPSAITYLEFGAIDLKSGKKLVWDFRLHQKAYDWLMLARYANDLAAYNRMRRGIRKLSGAGLARVCREEIHHEDDVRLNVKKLCALHACGARPGIFAELGQTLFGCIEGMEFCQDYLATHGVIRKTIPLQNVKWVGVDISALFNQLAVEMHPRYLVQTHEDCRGLPSRADVFFAKGVSLLYAMKSAGQMGAVLKKFRLGVFDYSFAMGGTIVRTIGSGKTLTHIGWNPFRMEKKKHGKQLYVNPALSQINEKEGMITVDCLYGDEKMCRRFIEIDEQIQGALADRKKKLGRMASVLSSAGGRPFTWTPLEQYLENQGKRC